MQIQDTKNSVLSKVDKQEATLNSSSHILLVDDNDQLRNVLDQVFKTNGFNVTSLPSAKHALNWLQTHSTDLIVCDIMMPGMDGFQFQKELSLREKLFDIPFVFLSGLSDPGEVRLGKESGCDDYLTKPFEPEELLAVVKGKCKLYKQRKALHQEKLEGYRRRIIQTLSHEFRTPLVAINTGTELLLDRQEKLDDQKVQHLLLSIQRGGLRLQRLVEDFMTLQQIDSGAAAVSSNRFRRKTSLVSIAETAIESFKQDCGDDNLLIELKVEDKEAVIVAFDIQLIDAVKRLLNNAHKFSVSENLITVKILTDGVSSSIVVKDRGPGLPTKVLHEAKTLFAQVNREKLEQQGCGLGLTIVHYFTELNGGTLEFITPQDGVGLEVELRFPTAR